MKIIMPGPIFSVPSAISDSIDLFQSCEDVQEAWVCDGDSQQASKAHVNGFNGIETHFNGTEIHVNGYQTGIKSKTLDVADQKTRSKKMDATSEADKIDQAGQEGISAKDMTCGKDKQGDMEQQDEMGEAQVGEGGDDDDLAESINIPVLEARLSVDISQALTRQKIASVQRGRTLSFADKEESEDSPIMSSRFFSHKDSLELGGLPQGSSHLAAPSGSTPKMEKSVKIFRNPSYHSAVRVSPMAESPPATKSFTLSSQNYTSSSEGTPEHDSSFASAETIHKFPAKARANSACGAFAKNQPLDVPVAANMPRSASFSGGGILSPSSPVTDSFRQVYGRRGSISQPSTPVTKRAQLPKPLPKEVTHHHHQQRNNNNNTIKITRGSALTRSFRRLFSTPMKSSNPPAEEYWCDTPEPDSPTPSEARSTSRLRKLSTNLSRKLSTRTKMSNSYSFPSGTNGHGQGINGEIPDSSKLVDYEELMKLFSCSGCQSIMAPPLHQCRKGHLVCNTCRLSLKQVCPVCRQRFAETTNLMMEQVRFF
ncbi:transcription factor GATA-6-like [Palaemon carinicauda]|uniref:transcription factor GATA-6-like n=1 Tax=Palaemon carinicauda TaxID=392227 RepID=UPI0035B67CDB